MINLTPKVMMWMALSVLALIVLSGCAFGHHF